MAIKFDIYEKKWRFYRTPRGACTYQFSRSNYIQCAECGRKIKYFESEPSKVIFNRKSRYRVCSSCAENERSRFTYERARG